MQLDDIFRSRQFSSDISYSVACSDEFKGTFTPKTAFKSVAIRSNVTMLIKVRIKLLFVFFRNVIFSFQTWQMFYVINFATDINFNDSNSDPDI